MIQKIVSLPNKVLTTPARKVLKLDKKTANIIKDMKDTLLATRNPKGVGLAAPQIDIPLRIFITRPTEKSEIRVFINPEIIKKSEEKAEINRDHEKGQSVRKDNKLEGCLSIPNIWGYLKRSKSLTLKFTDEIGNVKEEEFDGFMATIIQHETDHLNGVLFPSRVLEQKEKLYEIEDGKDGKEKLVELDI
jgi:peptide deformylase